MLTFTHLKCASLILSSVPFLVGCPRAPVYEDNQISATNRDSHVQHWADENISGSGQEKRSRSREGEASFPATHACKRQRWAAPRLLLLAAARQTSVRRSLKLSRYGKHTQPSAIYQAKHTLSACQSRSRRCQTDLGSFITRCSVLAGKPFRESRPCGFVVSFSERFFQVRGN